MNGRELDRAFVQASNAARGLNESLDRLELSASQRLEQRRPAHSKGKIQWARHNGSREQRRRQKQAKRGSLGAVFCPAHPANLVNPSAGLCSECLAAKFK